jgi:hypothetical protein
MPFRFSASAISPSAISFASIALIFIRQPKSTKASNVHWSNGTGTIGVTKVGQSTHADPQPRRATEAPPLATDGEAEKAFATYKNYLVHIDRCLGGIYGVETSLIPSVVAEVRCAKKYRAIQRRKPSAKQLETVGKALTIAWTKELQLRIPAAFDPQLLPHQIQGSGHLAYYGAFHGARGLFLSAGQDFSPTHASALSTLSTWVKDRKLFPVPWSVHCEGGPDRPSMTIGGLPAHATFSGMAHPLRSPSPDTVWDSLQMLLSTTRDRQIEERKEAWRKETHKKRTPAAETAKICTDLPPTTLFSVLWRLRRRTDYVDADAFLEGVTTAADAEEYHTAICRFMHATLAIFETITVAYLGTDRYREATDRFLSLATGPGSEALGERRAVILAT